MLAMVSVPLHRDQSALADTTGTGSTVEAAPCQVQALFPDSTGQSALLAYGTSAVDSR
ncbi:MAG: hypothetical protein AB1505_34585 [Candidatus Latescibacterota bacterium]